MSCNRAAATVALLLNLTLGVIEVKLHTDPEADITQGIVGIDYATSGYSGCWYVCLYDLRHDMKVLECLHHVSRYVSALCCVSASSTFMIVIQPVVKPFRPKQLLAYLHWTAKLC